MLIWRSGTLTLFLVIGLLLGGPASAEPPQENPAEQGSSTGEKVIAADETSAIEHEVMAAFESLVRASRALDAELYFQHFDSERFVGLNSDGTTWNSLSDLAPLIVGGFESIQTIHSLEFPHVKISVIDRYTAVLVNEFVQSMQLRGGQTVQVSGGGAQVWSKRSGSWKIVSVSASDKK